MTTNGATAEDRLSRLGIHLPDEPTPFGERFFYDGERYGNLIYFHEVDKGGHFAAWEQPELCAAELRAAFRSLH